MTYVWKLIWHCIFLLQATPHIIRSKQHADSRSGQKKLSDKTGWVLRSWREIGVKECVLPTSLISDFHMYIFTLLLQSYARVMQKFFRKITLISFFLKNEYWGQESGWEWGVRSCQFWITGPHLQLQVVFTQHNTGRQGMKYTASQPGIFQPIPLFIVSDLLYMIHAHLVFLF